MPTVWNFCAPRGHLLLGRGVCYLSRQLERTIVKVPGRFARSENVCLRRRLTWTSLTATHSESSSHGAASPSEFPQPRHVCQFLNPRSPCFNGCNAAAWLRRTYCSCKCCKCSY